MQNRRDASGRRSRRTSGESLWRAPQRHICGRICIPTCPLRKRRIGPDRQAAVARHTMSSSGCAMRPTVITMLDGLEGGGVMRALRISSRDPPRKSSAKSSPLHPIPSLAGHLSKQARARRRLLYRSHLFAGCRRTMGREDKVMRQSAHAHATPTHPLLCGERE